MTRIGSRKSFDLEWIERWARQVNDDRILPVIGRFFNGKFVLGVDETDYLIEVRGGKVQRIAEGLAPNDLGFDFALRAASSAWASSPSKSRHRCSTTSGPWRIRCMGTSGLTATLCHFGKTFGR